MEQTVIRIDDMQTLLIGSILFVKCFATVIKPVESINTTLILK